MITVAIIGAGPLGRWLALAAARAGFRVLLEDVMPTNLHHAQEYIRHQLNPQRLAEPVAPPINPHHEITELTDSADLRDRPVFTEDTGFLEGTDPGPHTPSPNATGDLPPDLPAPVVHFVATIEDAVREADLVIDCVPDELESKLEILFLLDRMAPPRTVLATPTTHLSIVDLASCTYRADKCVAIVAEARGLAENPASVILLRTTPETSSATIDLVRHFWQQLGYTPTFEPDPTPTPA